MTIKRAHFNVLIGLNSFILFFVLVESRLDIPAFLQVFGRLHPLLLHFPIVLLFLSWLLVFFRKRIEKSFPESTAILRGLVFISALLCSATVVMGLLLSKEGGYEGSSFEWHKWTGVSLSFLSFFLFYSSSRQQQQPYPMMFKLGMNLSLLLLLVVGHFGANLTHGENFVLAPITSEPPKTLNLETATVFHDAVLPILETKCMSCHNPDKAKGELILLDSASLSKGGKTGPLFLAGSPMESLLMERLLLDINHKHRMPPKGKPQLTQEEIDLFQAWIASGLPFNAPLRSSGDTLLQAAKMVYGIQEKSEHYAFSAADAQTIKTLTTPYRIIQPLAAGSPALAVNFYGREFYKEGALSELLPLAQQIVSLNISGMPIQPNELLHLKEFVNLRELNLNDTEMKDQDLSVLAALSKLKSIKLSGTKLSGKGLKHLLDIPSLRKLFVWNTPIQEHELVALRKQFPETYIDGGTKNDESVKLPLTAPKITPSRIFFRNKMPVSFSHPIAGVEIHYTLDGTDPEGATALVYTQELMINQNSTLRVKAVKAGWLASTEIKQRYMNSPILPKRISLDYRPHHLYRGNEANSLIDLESGGSTNVDGKWIGFQDSDAAVNLTFDAPQRIDSILLSIKQSYNEHIYPPERIEVWGGLDSSNMRLLTTYRPPLEKPEHVQSRRLVSLPVRKDQIGYIKLKAMPYPKIPTPYPASGNRSWIFLDELLIK